ncbi:unnamed protein product [Lampetra fluviatilis]
MNAKELRRLTVNNKPPKKTVKGSGSNDGDDAKTGLSINRRPFEIAGRDSGCPATVQQAESGEVGVESSSAPGLSRRRYCRRSVTHAAAAAADAERRK